MQVTLDLIGDSDSHAPTDVLLTGEHTEKGDVLRFTLTEPRVEFALNRAELYRALSSGLWGLEP